jgi:hypothetical protein
MPIEPIGYITEGKTRRGISPSQLTPSAVMTYSEGRNGTTKPSNVRKAIFSCLEET